MAVGGGRELPAAAGAAGAAATAATEADEECGGKGTAPGGSPPFSPAVSLADNLADEIDGWEYVRPSASTAGPAVAKGASRRRIALRTVDCGEAGCGRWDG